MTGPLIGGEAPSDPGPFDFELDCGDEDAGTAEDGQSAPEYALLMVLCVVLAIVILALLFGCQPSL